MAKCEERRSSLDEVLTQLSNNYRNTTTIVSNDCRSTPAIQMPKRLAFQSMFGLNHQMRSNHNHLESNQIIAINEDKSWFEVNKENVSYDCRDNTLGLSPVRKRFLFNASHTEKLVERTEIARNIFGVSCNLTNSLNNGAIEAINNDSFRSVDSNFFVNDLSEEKAITVEQTFLSPNSRFEGNSMDTYFRKGSQRLSDNVLFDDMIVDSIKANHITCEAFDFDTTFTSVDSEISASDDTLDIYKKIMNRNKETSVTCEQIETFSPSLKSTKIMSANNSFNASMIRSISTSGIGSVSQPLKNNEFTTINNMLSLSELLTISPTELELNIGCYVSYKLNYLKVNNRSVTPFKAYFKLLANVEILNSLQIKYPLDNILIPSFFNGILTDQIIITPLKCGTFKFVLEIYPIIENVLMAFSPLLINCEVRSEPVYIQLQPNSLNTYISYNFFKDCENYEYIEFKVANRYFSNEIPIKFLLKGSNSICFQPIYRLTESPLNCYRSPNEHTLLMETKSSYNIRIPIKIYSFEEEKAESTLTVSIDSDANSHLLNAFKISAKFWPKNVIGKYCLQCSCSSINLNLNKWQEIGFRNKSSENAIQVTLQIVSDNNVVVNNEIAFTRSHFIISPISKYSIGLKLTDKLQNCSKCCLSVKYNGGVGKTYYVRIPIKYY